VSHPLLIEALALSQQALQASEGADLGIVASLDERRLQLLKSFRLEVKQVELDDRSLLQRIAELNDRSLGLLEHRRRGKGREMDTAAVGRRAVTAYSHTR
jgi:hypothetical protein